MAGTSHAWLWARISILAALLLGTFGTVINDEQDQASAMHNLGHGSLRVVEHPPQFYRISGDLHRAIRFEGPEPVGSTLLNYLAYPVMLTVQGADALAPVGIWTSIAVVALTWSLLPEERRPRRPWLPFLAVAILASGFRFPAVDIGLYGPVVSLQMTNLLLLGVAAAFIAAAVHRHVPGPSAHVAIATIVFGPLLFWGTRLKYSMLATTLACAAFWLVGEPSSFRRNLALGLVTALAVWNNLGEGGVLLAAGGVWLLVHLRSTRFRRPGWTAVGGAAAGLTLGLLPWAMENQVLRGHPMRAPYLVPVNELSAASDGGAEGIGPLGLLKSGFAVDAWQGPGDFLLNLLGSWTTGWRTEGDPIGVLVLAPLLALAGGTLIRRATWRRPDLLLAALMVAWHIALLTNRVVRQGWGLDVRLLMPLLPAVGLLAAPAIGAILAAHGPTAPRTVARVAGLWAAGGVLFLAVAGFTFEQGLNNWQVDRLLLYVWGLFGVALATIYAVGRRFRLIPLAAPAAAVALGLALALPLVWNALAAVGAPSSAPAEGDLRVSGFVPLVDDGRAWLSPRLFPPGPLPILTDEFGRVVFHPTYGYCSVDPSPCPWWKATGTEPLEGPGDGVQASGPVA